MMSNLLINNLTSSPYTDIMQDVTTSGIQVCKTARALAAPFVYRLLGM